MSEAAEVLAILDRLGGDPMSGVEVRPGADDAAIRRMQEAARRDLGEAVPEGYVSLLRALDGLQVNGAYFKTSEHLVAENLDVLQPGIVVLGNEGNVAEHVFDTRDRRFHTISMGYPDERLASFETFFGLLAQVLREQQVV